MPNVSPIRHYELYYHGQPYVMACGLRRHKLGEDLFTTVPKPASIGAVTCPDCLKSKIYQETVTTVEIGYDGNWRAYFDAERPKQ